MSTTPATSYYGYDAHGNITFLTDAAGAVIELRLRRWGDLVAMTGAMPNSRLYAGEEFDPDLGLINLRARQYSLTSGRFLTLDRMMGDVQNPTSLNRYLYANADAANLLDPLGLNAEYAGLASGVTGPLTLQTTIALGAAAKATTDVVMAAVAAYASVCTLYIIATALDSYVFESQMAIFTPPPPFQLCAARGPRDRGRTGKPSGTPNPCKHMSPHPTDPSKVIYKDPQTGKKIIKPKPPGFPDDC